jgi:hypothetical protein
LAPGPSTIIDGGQAGTVVTISTGSVVTLSNFTIRNGSACPSDQCVLINGGGISNAGVLTINNSTVSGNIAIARSHSYGGGLVNIGTVTIKNSTFSGNTAGCGTLGCASYGGGILNYSQGSVTINNSTLSGNTAYGHFGSQGGGIFNYGTMTISSGTLSGDKANQGGGIYNSGGRLLINNSIVAGNSGGNCYGTLTSNGYNLSSDNSCNFSGPGDKNNINPNLGTLGSYGGPTQTIPLLSGSPAIDTGNPNGCTDSQGNLLTTDQRGMLRPDPPETTGCDRGAYESQSVN